MIYLKFNLDEKLEQAKDKEFYYGAKINKEIVDVYLGKGYIAPKDTRKLGPGRGHEEILYILKGQVMVNIKNREEIILNEGELIHLPNNLKAQVTNLSDSNVQYIIAGGHTKLHKH